MAAALDYRAAWCAPAPEGNTAPCPRRGGQREDLPGRIATVSVLHAPRETASAPPVRLTRRGVVVIGALVVAAAASLVWLAAQSAPTAGRAGSAAVPAGSRVTVHSGDTLWSIAARVAPDRDPRAEVDALQRANHLVTAGLVPGHALRIP